MRKNYKDGIAASSVAFISFNPDWYLLKHHGTNQGATHFSVNVNIVMISRKQFMHSISLLAD